MASTQREMEASVTGRSPRVDIRCVAFTVFNGSLFVALDIANAGINLPHQEPVHGEAIDTTARRLVRATVGHDEQYLEQLYTLGVSDDATETGWTIIISYIALISTLESLRVGPKATWVAVSAVPTLSGTDRMVIDYALVRLRAKIGYTTIAFHLMPETFTMSELQRTYEAVQGESLDKRNFRRRVTQAAMLDMTGEQRRDGSHRPAAVYRFRAQDDRDAYLTPPWAGQL